MMRVAEIEWKAEDTSGKRYQLLQLLKTITHFGYKTSSELYPKGSVGEGEIAPTRRQA